MTELRIGTRRSALAQWQARVVADRLERQSGRTCRLVPITSEGDRDTVTPLTAFGRPGVFTDALEAALRLGEIDAAVHSLKDVPTGGADDLCLAAIGCREDARDVLVAAERWTLATLPPGARVGTCSSRRTAQLRAARPDLDIVPLRGNVDSRVAQALARRYDAILIAAAGVIRLNLEAHIREYLPLDILLPAPGQGALAVQCRVDDEPTRRSLTTIDEADVRAACEAEREFLRALGGGCEAPVAAHAQVIGAGNARRVQLRGALAVDGTIRRVEGTAALGKHLALAATLATVVSAPVTQGVRA